ncbi:MAG TPA: serine hydrolase domain-containing protein [Verrucomicrobiae bacterium]|jgi:CubicO group peptidase (beta-lactamase class C family)|nr:serine hydrolase domain-containing protein [Verrucomicrobiae bacterium]
MKAPDIFLAGMIASMALAAFSGRGQNASTGPSSGSAEIVRLLIPVREKYHVPAMAAAYVTSKGLVAAGVVGVRKQGTDIAATLDDQWHLGSDTKAMTATLAAKLVEQNRLRWSATLAEIFPEWAAQFDPTTGRITICQLLTHRSGLPPNPDLAKYGGADGRAERQRLVREGLRHTLPHAPGSHYEYSNFGYIVAGAVIERVTSNTWEQAMQKEIFAPLGMNSVGFGGTGTPGRIDQPWGHDANDMPVGGNGPAMDNPPVLSPAGRVHCTIQDWAKFIVDQVRGARGEKALLQPASYHFLHTPPAGGEYALGWIATARPWAGGLALTHAGDNTMNCADVWIAPGRDFAILVCVNQTGAIALKSADATVSALISHPPAR